MKHISKPLTLAAAIFVGLFLSIAASAQLRGWGYNGEGTLGIGNTTQQPSPVIVSLPDTIGIGNSFVHSLYLKADGTVRASGRNFAGQLGNGTTTQSNSLVAVSGLTNAVQVSGGVDNSYALRADGTVWSWGTNGDGANGNGATTSNRLVPAQITTLSDVIQVEAGYYHYALALRSNGTVWAWGYNANGNLGDGTTTTRTTPVQVGASVAGFNNIIAVSAGEFHSMALKADGTVWIWGYNAYGQVGNGSTTPSNQLVPAQNTTVSNVVEIDTGNGYSSYVRRRDGAIFSWGGNWEGQMGNGTTNNTCSCQPSPVQSAVGTGNAMLGANYYNGFALNPIIPVTTGTNISILGENVKFSFNQITAAGNVTYTGIDPTTTGLTVPNGYTIQPNQPAYNITSTATTSGAIRICISVNEYNAANYPLLKVLHEEGAALVDRTSGYSAGGRYVCADTNGFSRFVVAQALVVTAANVTIAGRVLSSSGRAVSRAQVTFNDMQGNLRTAMTNQFGYFAFEEVEVGQTYVF